MGFLEDARRDMSRIEVPITWIHGKYDAWMDLDRVVESMSCGRTDNRRIIEVLLYPSNGEANEESNRDSAQRDEYELDRRITERKTSCRHGGDRKLQRDQRRRIINQTLAFHDCFNPTQHRETTNDRRRGDGVRG